jgi:hypothetical protein
MIETPSDLAENSAHPSAQTLFAIVCMGRTGSTLLVDMLGSHPRVECKGELFNPVKGEYLRSRTLATRQSYIGGEAFETNKPAKGFKMPFDWLLLQPGIIDEFRLLGYRIILLHRRNSLDHFISMKLAALSGYWDSDRPYVVETLRLDPWEWIRFSHGCDLTFGILAKLVEGMSSLSLYYEELFERDAQQRLLSLLDVPFHELKAQRTKRTRIKPVHEIIENYAEVVDFFHDTPYAHYFPSQQSAAVKLPDGSSESACRSPTCV